jgi:hypothetical protein
VGLDEAHGHVAAGVRLGVTLLEHAERLAHARSHTEEDLVPARHAPEATRQEGRLDEILMRADGICTASAQPRSIVWLMDIVAVAIGIASFALLLALIQGLDRV